MSANAKSQLFELVKDLGCHEDCVDFQSKLVPSSGLYHSTVGVEFPDGRTVQGSGESLRKSDAEIAAAKEAIEQLSKKYPELLVDWADIKVQAQAGDALIKLGIYLSATIKSAGDKSLELQSLESDSHLVRVFDYWKAQGDPDLAMWGSKLSEKRKATLVEALLWQRFGAHVLSPDASERLQTLIEMLVIE